MRPQNWAPPIELSEAEAKIMAKIRQAKLFIWLRKNRHLLFDEQLQTELAKIYKNSTVGLSPVPPAQLALAIILQAYTGVSDDEAIEAMVMDRRWQLVLDCLDCENAPFGKGTLVRFRAALMVKQIEKQDVEVTESGDPKLKKGVAKDRRISIEDAQMRHGRKSRAFKFNGYKPHVLKDLDSGMVRAVGITPANFPEASVSQAIAEDLALQQVTLTELHIDRAYLSCHLVKQRSDDVTIFCKAWRVRNGERFDKTAFVLDWDHNLIRCPNGVTIPFEQGKTARFPQRDCQVCPLKEECTTSKRGRSVSIHPDESLLQELRQRQLTAVGRSQLRERVSVEHSLAHISRWQGNQARYLGTRKNLFDLRRTAVVHNLHVIAQMEVQSEQKTAKKIGTTQ